MGKNDVKKIRYDFYINDNDLNDIDIPYMEDQQSKVKITKRCNKRYDEVPKEKKKKKTRGK